MAWYRTGTVTIVAGQTVVTGTGTNFPANSRVGDEFQGPDGRGYEIVNVTSETVLSILPPYMGPSVAGAAYGIKPINGYAKDLLDRINNLLLDFGGTLALFGRAEDAPTLRRNIEAAGSGGNSDITALYGLTSALTLEQGGTGGKTQPQARAGLGLRNAATFDVVGTVGGGGAAIIERGNNANGGYTKYADGTMECFIYEWFSYRPINLPAGSMFFAGPIDPRPFPVAFIGIPSVSQYAESDAHPCWLQSSSPSSHTSWGGAYFMSDQARGSSNLYIHRRAVGRWA